MAFDISRLYAALLNTGLQTRDNPLYQVIRSFIDVFLLQQKSINLLTPSSGGIVVAGPQGPPIFNLIDSDESDFAWPSSAQLSTSFTKGSVIFAGPSGVLSQNNAKLFWDDINFRLGIGALPDSRAILTLSGIQIGTSESYGILVSVQENPTAGNNAYAIRISSNAQKAGAGTHTLFAGLRVDAITILDGAAVVTNSATISVPGPSSGATNNYSIWVESGLSRFSGNVTIDAGFTITAGTLNITTIGPNAIGTSVDSRAVLVLGGNQSGSASESYGLLLSPGVAPANNNSAYGLRATNAFTKGSAGIHPIAATISVEAPGLVGGAATVTNSAALTIVNQGSGATNNYALWVQSGQSRYDGKVGINVIPSVNFHIDDPSGSSLRLSRIGTGVGYLQFDCDAIYAYISSGGVALPILFRINNVEQARLDANGNFGIGQTTITASLHIRAGTTAANTAPIKLTSGPVLATPEVGAIEFNTDDFFATITTAAARKAFILDNGSRLTSGKVPVATTNGRLVDSTASTLITAGISNIVASTFEKAETGSDANILTYGTGVADEFLVVQVAVDVSALTGTSVVVTLTWKDSNNATQTVNVTLSGVADGTINTPINAQKSTNVVVSSVFTGVSTAYNISAFITRLK